jgi:SOS-response transcriptional repressor LexA
MSNAQPTEEIFPLPRAILGVGDLAEFFLMKAHDDSMAEAGVRTGDWLIVHQEARPEPGQLAAVMEDGDAVVKWASEADMPETTFIGSVVAVLRRF